MAQTPPHKTAVVTGACSGIGLALVRNLLEKQNPVWRVVLADVNGDAYTAIAPSLDASRTTFVKTDVSSWEDNASLFKEAWEWDGQHQIDFFAANAGIGDRELIAQEFDLDAEPQKPNLQCLEVDLISVFYGLKLFIHYTRKTKRELSNSSHEASRTEFHPKMVITCSCTALYPFPIAPHYVTAKTGLLGLTRAVAGFLMASDGIAVNCIMPALVATGLPPSGMIDEWPKEWVTPTSTVMRAIDELIAQDGHVEQDGLSDGKGGEVKVGQSVEVVVKKLYYRAPYEYADESQKFLTEQALTLDGLWAKHTIPMFMAAIKAAS